MIQLSQKRLQILTGVLVCLVIAFAGIALSYRASYIQTVRSLDEYRDDASRQIIELNRSLVYSYQEREQILMGASRLNASYSILLESHNYLNKSYARLSDDMRSLASEVDTTMMKIDMYERELEESMAWFRDNSALDGDRAQREIGRDLLRSCMRKDEGTCTIRTGCVYLHNQRELDLGYKPDSDTSSRDDRLQSIEQFLENGGGDCEDYSLFFKAEMRSLADGCDDDEIVMDAWVPAEDEKAKYYLDFSGDWYLPRARRADLPKGYINPVVVCGRLMDPNTGKRNGHCVIAFTKEPMSSLSDLEDAPMIEPQTGEYLGRINHESSDVVIQDRGRMPGDKSYVFEVITDDDLLLYSEVYLEWMSYGSYKAELDEKKRSLAAIGGPSYLG